MKYLILGDGLLGQELKKQTNWDFVSRKNNNIEFDKDFEKYCEIIKKYDVIVNCIAFTKTYSEDKDIHWNINYKRTCDLVDFCSLHDKKLIHISTDYVYSGSIENATEKDVPVHCCNWYGYTKLLSDGYVQLRSKKYLLIRTSFKPNPFPYDKAIISQTGNFDYVDVISSIIISLIIQNKEGLYNVGTEQKTVYDLAIKTKPDIFKLDEKIHTTMPTNITMCCDKLNGEL